MVFDQLSADQLITNHALLPYEKRYGSQHDEDGIIETMLSFCSQKNYTAIEIGSGNGVQNMLRNLVDNHGYLGIGHDAVHTCGWPHEKYLHHNITVTLQNLGNLIATWPTLIPDFFSLDIDSYDFWVLKSLLQDHAFRPKIMCVEYMSLFGPNTVVTARADLSSYHGSSRGCSLQLLKIYLNRQGYKFFTCDSSGVNAFWYDPVFVNDELLTLPTYDWAFLNKHIKLWNGHKGIFNDPNVYETDITILLG